MTIKDIRDLKKIMKLCRESGVHTFRNEGMELIFTSEYIKPKASTFDYEAFPEAGIRVPQFTPVNVQETESENIRVDMPDELSEDQLLFYSAKAEAQ